MASYTGVLGDVQEQLAPSYDADAFDSMTVINSEMWNAGEEDEGDLTLTDLLPNGVLGLSTEALREVFLRAAQSGVLEAVKLIHHHCGPEIIHTTDTDNYTALHRASYNGHTTVVEYLLTHGASVDSRTVDGLTPLHSACRWNKAEVASLLLQNGAKINSKSHGGQTALHLAAVNDRARDTLELLLRHRELDTELRTGQGDTAFELAERNGKHSYLFEMVGVNCDHRRFLQCHSLKLGDRTDST